MRQKYIDLIENADLTECVEWPWARTPRGYGVGHHPDRRVGQAHRIVYEWWTQHLPADKHVHHTCENPACVNPLHLRCLTAREHTLLGRGITAREARQTHCLRGHPFDADNTRIRKGGRRACRACDRLRCSARDRHTGGAR